MQYIVSPLGLIVIQGLIAVGVAWAIHKLQEVHALVNSRSKVQDDKIATLTLVVDDLRRQLSTQNTTLAVERALTSPQDERKSQ